MCYKDGSAIGEFTEIYEGLTKKIHVNFLGKIREFFSTEKILETVTPHFLQDH